MKLVKKLSKFIMSRKKLLLIAAGLIVLILIVRPLIFHPKPAVESIAVTRGSLKQELTLSGKVEASEHATLQFASGGLLSWLGVKEGDWVNKYQTVASLDSRLAQNALQKTLNIYQKTRLDFDQITYDNRNYLENPDQDFRNKTARTLTKAQIDLNNSVLDVESQNIGISLASISTPISGIVTKVNPPFAGVNIAPFQSAIEVVNPYSLYFEVTADQTEVAQITEGMKVKIVLDAFPQSEFEGSVENMSFVPKEGETSTTYKVEIDISNFQTKNIIYRIDMTGDATFVTGEKENVLQIPLKFLKSDNKGNYVLVGKEKKKTYIETGMETDTDAEVTKGLSEGEVVYD
ncbi:efflux RND transporter periplasmic adaptor subunit [Patescibacteria group bacterium]|nr:efflux RND transporter periplasmic adaptor subunit [Patescibacteria group bacterium]